MCQKDRFVRHHLMGNRQTSSDAYLVNFRSKIAGALMEHFFVGIAPLRYWYVH